MASHTHKLKSHRKPLQSKRNSPSLTAGILTSSLPNASPGGHQEPAVKPIMEEPDKAVSESKKDLLSPVDVQITKAVSESGTQNQEGPTETGSLNKVLNSEQEAEDPAQPSLKAQNATLEQTEALNPPSQPGNEAIDLKSTDQEKPVQNPPPTVPLGISIPTALPSTKLSLEAAIERIDGMLRRIALEHDKENFFQEKVSTDVQGCKDYYQRIDKPMWFALIREKLRKREYRTLHQVQADVELICQNAMVFNQKISKVYKNAQSLLKAAKKQFGMERPLLHEAILALHPVGPEAALKDEAEEQKTLRMPPPPKKPPAKPSKPSKVEKKRTVVKPIAGTGPVPPALSFIAPVDLQMDLHDDLSPGYSSFSDSEDEVKGTKVGHSVSQPWAANSGQDDFPTSMAAIQSQDRPEEWKDNRVSLESRIKWLEHRLQELGHQHKRYSVKLEQLNVGDETASTSIAVKQGSLDTAVPEGAASGQIGPGKRRFERKKSRRTARGLAGSEILSQHPSMALYGGIRLPRQEAKHSRDADLSEEDVNFPARVYAGAELLEQHMHGLRQQLCQPGYDVAFRRKPMGSQSQGKQGLRSRSHSDKIRAAKRQKHVDYASSFVFSSTQSASYTLPEKAKTIETPAYTELTEDDLRERLALLEACRKKDQLKKEPPSPGQLATVYESSSEDTSDEKYNRLHSVEEAKERAYENEPSKKKKKLKTSNREETDTARIAKAQTPTTVVVQTGGLKGVQSQKPVTVTVSVETPQANTPVSVVSTPASVATQATTISAQGTPLEEIGLDSAKGRSRGRGRPLGSSKLAVPGETRRQAGPGRGHKRARKSALDTPSLSTPQSMPLSLPQAPQSAPGAIESTQQPKSKSASASPKVQDQKVQASNAEKKKQAALKKQTSNGRSISKSKSPKKSPGKS